MKQRIACTGCLALIPLLWAVAIAGAAVIVEDDEVVFSLIAPNAQRVFLVGDFNNWNPTLERMDKIGDTFQVRLFLLPGSYHYKYVVDGAWMADPDNPAADARQGSPLVLEERAGTLTMGDGSLDRDSALFAIQPTARYRGAFTLDDGKTDDQQSLDFYFAYDDDKVRSLADFKTTSDSWRLSPLETEIDLDRGFVELKLGNTAVVGFDNDTIWTSHDPFRLVGDVGVYDYNAGYERRGFSLQTHLPLKTDLRLLYSDKIDRNRFAKPVVVAADFGSFQTSGGADTTVYRFGNGSNDQDTWAMEFFTDMGSLNLGWVSRSNRGFHPGLLVEVARNGAAFDVTTFGTREYWDADVVWLRWEFANDLAASAAWGVADTHIRQGTRSLSTVALLGSTAPGPNSEPFDTEIPLLSSKRWNGRLDYKTERLRAGAGFVHSRFEFDPVVNEGAEADVTVVVVDGSFTGSRWRVGGALTYTDQDYGATPDEFHYRTPTRNFWLDDRDRLGPADLPAFDLAQTTRVGLTLARGERVLATRSAVAPLSPFILALSLDLTTSDFFERLEYVAPRFSGEHALSRYVYLQADARVAWYNKPSWGVDETFFSTYWEVGYRREWGEVSAGWGFDPVVLDEVVNDYRDNGREELIRQAIGARTVRSGSKQLGDRVRAQENILEDFQSLLKLEVILLF